ncbi:MAG: V-type ATP synthase subunit A [Nitrospinae bacterium]|nr:V-type ATP synthase subunit A [Nitrospinota bacterium]
MRSAPFEGAAIVILQVYEDTGGLYPGERVTTYGKPLTVELGPGLLSGIFDGIQRPLTLIKEETGDFIKRGIHVNALDRTRKWRFTPMLKSGERAGEGDTIGTVEETPKIIHKIKIPQGVSGVVEEIREGEFGVEDVVAIVGGNKIGRTGVSPVNMMQEWSVRSPRPYKKKLPPDTPFITGQRVFDMLFPLAEGGAAVVPGGFGTGKTVIEQSLAKFAMADIIVYVGCGERGNEMTEVLTDFPNLTDPVSGLPLMSRTILVINTSNMPVAAREASIFTGITMAEYYRDMGYRVAMMVDSTSRWAEALREISSRMEEMPGEEGYPPYLATRLGNFYERAGKVTCLGRDEKRGSVTIISAISPPGGDFSEPVTQASLRAAGALWALDTDLAYRRHFPAVNWIRSFSLYTAGLKDWLSVNVYQDVNGLRKRLMSLLQKVEELKEVVQLVGLDALQDSDRVTVDAGNIIVEGFLRQSMFHALDSFCSFEKQYWMLRCIFEYYDGALKSLGKGVDIEKILDNPCRIRLLRMNDCRNEDMKKEAEILIKEIGATW